MADEIHNVRFGNLMLEMQFRGDNFESASVKIKTIDMNRNRTLEEGPEIPVKSLHDLSYLINLSLRREVLRLEKQLKQQKEGE